MVLSVHLNPCVSGCDALGTYVLKGLLGDGTEAGVHIQRTTDGVTPMGVAATHAAIDTCTGSRVAIGLGSIGCRASDRSRAAKPEPSPRPPLHPGVAPLGEPTNARRRGWFLNAVGLFHSELEPQALLDVCIDIEDRARGAEPNDGATGPRPRPANH